jgi:hypothetical protein
MVDATEAMMERAAKAIFAKANEPHLSPEKIEALWPSQHKPHWYGLARAALTASEAVARCEAAESSLAEARALKSPGAMLANAAYNIYQRGQVDADSLRALKEAQEAWDAVVAKVR